VAGTGVSIEAPVVPAITTDDIYNPDAPTQTLTEMLAGISSAKMVGSAVVDATTVGNIPLFTVPIGKIFIPTEVVFALTHISGSGNPPAINLGVSGQYLEFIDSVLNTTYSALTATPFNAGAGYVPGDTLTLVGGTHSVVSTLTVTDTKLVSAAINAIGTGYAPNDTITLAGGVPVTRAVVTLNTTQLASTSLNAAGTTYAPGDTITLAGGTAATKAVLTVDTVKLVSATINAGGTGYGNTQTFNVTVAGGTGSPAAVVNVTTNSGGVVTTVNSITTPGSYTVLPTLTGNAVTGDDGTDHGSGLTLDLVFGVATFTISTRGSYSVNSATFTQDSTSGSGSGATFNNGLFGVHTFTITGFGDYTSNAASFTQFATSGAGTGATFNTTSFGVLDLTVAAAGTYTVLPANHCSTTGGTGTGATVDMDWEVVTSSFSTLTTADQLMKITDFVSSGSNYSYVAAGTDVKLRVQFAATYPTYSLMCFLFGFVTNTPA
jgi:hypothetical protein